MTGRAGGGWPKGILIPLLSPRLVAGPSPRRGPPMVLQPVQTPRGRGRSLASPRAAAAADRAAASACSRALGSGPSAGTVRAAARARPAQSSRSRAVRGPGPLQSAARSAAATADRLDGACGPGVLAGPTGKAGGAGDEDGPGAAGGRAGEPRIGAERAEPGLSRRSSSRRSVGAGPGSAASTDGLGGISGRSGRIRATSIGGGAGGPVSARRSMSPPSRAP